MKSANNKLTIIADVLLLLLFAAVLGFIIWRFGDLFGLTGDKNKFYIWLAGIMSFIFLRASRYFSRLYRVRRERRQAEEQGEYPEKEIRYEPGKEHLCILNYFSSSRPLRSVLAASGPSAAGDGRA